MTRETRRSAATSRTVRASEIATYIYCRRAWWYQQQGHTPASSALDSGLAWHHRHGRRVLTAGALRAFGWGLIIVAAAAAAILIAEGLAG